MAIIIALGAIYTMSSRLATSEFFLIEVLGKERKMLKGALVFVAAYIFVTALMMSNFEPCINPNTGQETFRTFFDVIYWSTVTLTTVGYGDLCPAIDLRRLISMFSSLFGVAVIALPFGIITASYLDELRIVKEGKEK